MGPLCGLRLGQNASLTLNNNNNIGPKRFQVLPLAWPCTNLVGTSSYLRSGPATAFLSLLFKVTCVAQHKLMQIAHSQLTNQHRKKNKKRLSRELRSTHRYTPNWNNWIPNPKSQGVRRSSETMHGSTEVGDHGSKTEKQTNKDHP